MEWADRAVGQGKAVGQRVGTVGWEHIPQHIPGRYRVQPVVHSCTEKSAGSSSAATGTGCGWPCCSAHPITGTPCTQQGVLCRCPIVTLLSSCAALTGCFSSLKCHACTKPSSIYSPSALGRQVRELLGHVFCAKEGSGTLTPFSSALFDTV